jgi:type II secretion system protein I
MHFATIQNSRSNEHQGFTLIEVMVAVLILSTGIIVVLQGYQLALSALEAARDSLRADVVLRERMAQIEAEAIRPEGRPCPFAGSDLVARQWAYQRDVAGATVDHSGNVTLRSVVVTTWRKGSDRRHTLATYVLEGSGP